MAIQMYRLSPVLWDSVPGQHTATVYGIDRFPEGPLAKFVTCCSRCKDDPAYWWAGPTWLRLIMPVQGCCSGPQDIGNGVPWSLFPTWLSWAMSNGYTVQENFKFIPGQDITIIYRS